MLLKIFQYSVIFFAINSTMFTNVADQVLPFDSLISNSLIFGFLMYLLVKNKFVENFSKNRIYRFVKI